MSDQEEKSSNDEEKTQRSQDEGSKNPKIITEGNVCSDSNKNTETSGAISENMPRLAPIEGSGDDKGRILQDNLELDKIDAKLTETSNEILKTGASKGSSDYTAKPNVSGIDDKEIDDVNTEIDAIICKTNVTAKKDERNDTFLHKCDEIESKNADDLDEIEDEDMELRWDDDDASNQAMGDDNGNTDTKNDDILSEEQLLEEPSDVLNKDMTEMTSDENPKVSEANLDSDVLKVISEEISLTRDNNSKEIETSKESEISPKLDTPTDKAEDEKCLEDELLQENDLNTEAINSPEMDFSTEESIDRDDINVLEDKLLEDSGIATEAAVVIAQAKEILEEKSMDEPVKETESEKDNLTKEVTTDEQTKEDPAIEEDQLLSESEINTETETSTLKLKSPTDVILNKDNDDIMSEENLLEEPDSRGESSLIISEKDIGLSKIVPEKEVPVNKENNDDVLLEEKLLQEMETAEVIPESDITMDVDDEEEGELLKDDECQKDSPTPMDVDNTDTATGDKAKVEDKILDQTMNQSEVDKKDIALTIAHQTNIEKVNEKTIKNVDRSDDQSKIIEDQIPIDDQTNIEKEYETTIKNMEQSDDQSKIIEKDIDQPLKDTSNAVDIIKDTCIEDEPKIDENIVDKAITEKENIDQHIDDQTKMEDSIKDQLIMESNTKEQSCKSPIQTYALTVSDAPNILVEDLKKPLPEKTTLEKEIENKIDSEFSEHISTDLDKTETSKETINPDSSLDKNEEVDEISPKNSSIFLEDSCPIKTDHGLNKPDVMLEIPTQELIDMDDTDLSMNLDHSEVIDSLNDVDKNVADIIVHEKATDETVIDDVIVSDKVVTDDATVTEKSVAKTKTDDGTISEKPVDQKAVATETTADKIIGDNDTVKEKSVHQEAIVTESTVSETTTESNIVESDKKVEDAVVQSTVEENMERMFADDEPEVAKEIAECIASTSQTQVPTAQPSTSITRMTPDTSDEVPEIDDSLGLLAESAGRMMEDDEEPDDDFDGDDDDDFDHDESSNQISAEQSEDSNQAALETEPVRDQEDKELETPDPKDEEFPFMMCDSTSQDKAEKMDVEEEYGTVELQAETVRVMNEEAKSAVDALLNADNEQAENQKETTDQMDIETVKLSDTSDNEIDVEPTQVQPTVTESSKENEEKQKSSPSKSPKSNISPKQSPSKLSQMSPSKMKNLAITTQEASSVVNIVDLEESSSSEDDIQEVQKQPEPETTEDDKSPSPESDVTNVNIPTGIDIMCTSGGNTSEITTKDNLSQVVISGVPKPPPHKPARLNTSEVTIKTASNTEPLIIPETKINEQNQTQSKPKLSLEIFSLDSDDDESAAKEKSLPTSTEVTALELEKARETSKCINYFCTSDGKVPYKAAEASVVAYYDSSRKRRSVVCQPCADVVAARTKNLIQGIKDLTPLLDLDMGKLSQDLVEISDSESEDEDMTPEEPKESIGEKGAKFIEDNLAKYLNDTWKKYDMDVRLKETQIMLDDEIDKLEQDSKEIDAMLNECQIATDKLRCELYATFECRRQQQPSLVICDTPDSKFIGLEEQVNPPAAAESIETRQAKRRLSSTSETPAKRPAIPLGYAPLDGGDSKEKAAIPGPDIKLDDDKDISVVKLSAEAAPADLPPPGEISRPPLRVGMPVYAMKNAFGPWLKGRVVEIQPKNTSGGNPFSLCLVKFDHKVKTNGKVLQARCIAYSEPADVRMTIGTRLIALFKDSNKRESYYSGVVAEIPNPVNNYRYLVFFDDGYAQYVQHQFTRLVCESSPLVWEEVHPFSREFVREYLLAYPERPMVRLHEGQHLKTEWNGKWWSSRVTRVDASLAQVMFVGDGRREWVYRGSTRLAPLYLELRAAERHRPRPMPRSKAQPRFNMPYVEYTRSDEQEPSKPVDAQAQQQQQQQQQQIQNEEIRRQRAVAKKSTSAPPQVLPPSQQIMPPAHMDPVTSRVVYYTPKNAVKPLKMAPHRCGARCKRSDVLSLKELRTYNPLAKPLLSGWERQIVRFKGHKEVMYRAPCGRRLRNMRELHHYLRSIDSDLPVDLFDFHYSTHCLAEFVLNKCLVGKKDLSHGKENVPVPCVNYYDDSLPEFCSYNTERTPTAGVPLNLEPEFLCGCDCTDDCQDKSKCACWKMTLEGARTIGLRGPNVGYVYKRLPEPLPSGIYECNSRCKCKHTCLNRVAQHPLQLKLQVFKTPNRGWGIRALNDVPKGSFLCVYAGNLLTDATANLDGLNEGDEYLAELDYIEVVEQMKEGYEEDIPEADKKLDKKEAKDNEESAEDEPSSSEDEETADKTDKEDDDFRPGYIGLGVQEFNKRLRKREKSKKDKEKSTTDEKEKEKDTNKEANGEEDCITISDDEEVREPSRFMAQTNMGANEYISKYKSVRTLFGKDEACYIMDAKVQGNIGRYLNHSCCPNVFVQNVFVDTHDPRFPWVAFFALSHIKAGTELTWNYNYDVGSVPGKILYCYCGAPNCRGRLL